jgi:hypothetical protein
MITQEYFMKLHTVFPFPVTFDIKDGCPCWKTKRAGLKFCGEEDDKDLIILLYDSPVWGDFKRETIVEADGAVDLFIAINCEWEEVYNG